MASAMKTGEILPRRSAADLTRLRNLRGSRATESRLCILIETNDGFLLVTP